MLKYLFIVFTVLIVAQPGNAEIYKYITDDGIIVFSDVPPDGKAEVVKEPLSISSPLPSESVSRRDRNIKKYYPIVKDKADHHSLDPELIKAMITVESNWHPAAVSPKGAMGLMQLMPQTAKALSVDNPFNPEENISGGVRYFRTLLDYFKGSLRRALAAYNAGPKRVASNAYFPEGSETRTYVNKILRLYGGEEKFKYRPLGVPIPRNTIYKLLLDDGTLLFTDTIPASYGSYRE